MINLGMENLDSLVDEYVILSTTDLDGYITYASSRFAKMSGYTAKELIGKPHSIVRHPDVKEEVFADMWNTIENNKEWRGEVKNLKQDGGYYWVDTVVSPIFDLKTGKKIGYKSLRFDITAYKDLLIKTHEAEESDAMTDFIKSFLIDRKSVV